MRRRPPTSARTSISLLPATTCCSRSTLRGCSSRRCASVALPQGERHLVERAHQALEGAEDLLTDLLDISKLDQAAIKPDIDIYTLDDVLLPLVSEFNRWPLPPGFAEAPRSALRRQNGLPPADTDSAQFPQQRLPLYRQRRRADRRAQTCRRAAHRGLGHRKGIPEELQAIFLEFNQLGIGRSTKRSGVGLGLAIVDRIANMLDYPVLVRSRPGRGSVFSIDVPLADASPRERIATPVSLPQLGDPLPGRRLLVIDNERAFY